MGRAIRISILFGMASLGFAAVATADELKPGMSFFITSTGLGTGANLGGLTGADALCQMRATSAGAGAKSWHAYLSTQGAGAVDARERIGKGPWTNAKGVVIATSVDHLHSAENGLTKQTALTEKGDVVNGRGDNPNRHDIMTGSTREGRAFAGDADMTCKNYTSATAGAVMLGHSDRIGLGEPASATSWNAAHPSRGPGGGCTQTDLQSTGGDGLLYCFAVN
jgi:hypothetical protein